MLFFYYYTLIFFLSVSKKKQINEVESLAFIVDYILEIKTIFIKFKYSKFVFFLLTIIPVQIPIIFLFGIITDNEQKSTQIIVSCFIYEMRCV